MEFNVEARRLQLGNLKQFISSSKNKIENILTNLGWNEKEVLRDKQLITCSLDTNHKVPPKSVDKHMEKCILRKEHYDLNEPFLSEPQKGPHVISIDDHKKIEILSAAHKLIENFKSGWNGQDPDPKTSNRLLGTFSSDERLALYDYAIANTIGPPDPPEFDVVNPKRTDDRPLTYEETLALERDMKRRKIKYKSIHTSHKNHTEVLREVIDSQMELYKDWLNMDEKTVDLKEKQHDIEPFELEQTRSTTIESIELEQTRSTAASRSSNISSSSRNTHRRYEEKSNEDILLGSHSTSRRTSIDRESEKSNTTELSRHRGRRSRSHDSYHRKHRENNYKKYPEKIEHHRHRERDYRESNRSDRHRYDKYKDRSPIHRRRSSSDRKYNGYKNSRY